MGSGNLCICFSLLIAKEAEGAVSLGGRKGGDEHLRVGGEIADRPKS